jgi:hypothetical protein
VNTTDQTGLPIEKFQTSTANGSVLVVVQGWLEAVRQTTLARPDVHKDHQGDELASLPPWPAGERTMSDGLIVGFKRATADQ